MHIAVIGAGHAGVEAAVYARKAGADVTLYSSEPVLPYFRPRLIALAFGHVKLTDILMHPADWYDRQGIRLRLDSSVIAMNPALRQVTVDGVSARYDAVVVACGAHPLAPPLSGAPSDLPILPLWSAADADAIRSHIRPGARLTILGGGILGIETALNAVDAGLSVTVVERQERLMPMQFAPEGSALIHRLLTARGIRIRLGVASDGSDLDADFVVLAIGSRPNRDLAVSSDLATARGVLVDEHLQTAAQGVFAAGDAAELKGVFRPSVREASAQGRAAGANAAAAAAGLPLQPYVSSLQPLMFKYGGFDLASEGAAWGPDCTIRPICEDLLPDQYRALIIREGKLAGVQAVGTRKEFDGWCKRIGEAVS